jgi:RNase H-fold protein (predicted Holliday junction resolvase)
MFFGFDPGKDKCGLALVSAEGQLIRHEVIPAPEALSILQRWADEISIKQLILGDQTGSKQWRSKIQARFPDLEIITIDERYSSLEARDRYWQLYPAQGLQKLIPQGMRQPPRPIDDLVAVILVERYLARLKTFDEPQK